MVMIKTLAMKESRAWFGRLWMVEKILFLNVSTYKSYFTSASGVKRNSWLHAMCACADCKCVGL